MDQELNWNTHDVRIVLFYKNKSNAARLPLLAILVSLGLSCHMMESHKQNNNQQQTLLSSSASDITPIVPHLPLGATLATFHQDNDTFGDRFVCSVMYIYKVRLRGFFLFFFALVKKLEFEFYKKLMSKCILLFIEHYRAEYELQNIVFRIEVVSTCFFEGSTITHKKGPVENVGCPIWVPNWLPLQNTD